VVADAEEEAEEVAWGRCALLFATTDADEEEEEEEEEEEDFDSSASTFECPR
jgi:hypothetical protein